VSANALINKNSQRLFADKSGPLCVDVEWLRRARPALRHRGRALVC